MSEELLPARKARQTITGMWMVQIAKALSGNLVPRNPSGAPQYGMGRLGTAEFPFERAHVRSGEYGCGTIVPVYDYANLTTPCQGWMLCNGDIICEEAYDAQYTRIPGDWERWVADSPLAGKRLPNMVDRYLVGASTTPQTGAAPLTYTGNAGSKVNLRHSHLGSTNAAVRAGLSTWAFPNPPLTFLVGDHIHTINTPQDLSATQDVRPESIVVKHYMRII